MLEQTEKRGRSTTKWGGAVSNDLRRLQNRSRWEVKGRGVCVFVFVCASVLSVGVGACVHLRAGCGGANGVLIAWQ